MGMKLELEDYKNVVIFEASDGNELIDVYKKCSKEN